jgi:hypothetical protein
VVWLWLFVGFMTSAVTLHIATLLLLDNPSFARAAAVSAATWLLGALFVVAHVGGGLLFSLASLAVGCAVLKRLYGVGIGQALIVFFLHGIVEIAIALVLWLALPSGVWRDHLPRHAARGGSGCLALRPQV